MDQYFTLEVGVGPWVIFQDILLQRCGGAGLRFVHGRNSRQDGIFHQSPTQQGLLPWFLQLFSKEEEKSIKTKFSQTRSGQAPLHQVGRRSCISTDTFNIKTPHRECCSPSCRWEDRPSQSAGLGGFISNTSPQPPNTLQGCGSLRAYCSGEEGKQNKSHLPPSHRPNVTKRLPWHTHE